MNGEDRMGDIHMSKIWLKIQSVRSWMLVTVVLLFALSGNGNADSLGTLNAKWEWTPPELPVLYSRRHPAAGCLPGNLASPKIFSRRGPGVYSVCIRPRFWRMGTTSSMKSVKVPGVTE